MVDVIFREVFGGNEYDRGYNKSRVYARCVVSKYISYLFPKLRDAIKLLQMSRNENKNVQSA